jgi:hypothetical protein
MRKLYPGHIKTFWAIAVVAIISSCTKKETGYYVATTKVTSVIQINANSTTYAISSAPDVISFSMLAVNTSKPNFRQYLVDGISAAGTLSFTMQFHIDSIGSGKYVLESSQLVLGSKSYISLAAKTTDKVTVTKLDAANKIYTGTFSFYSFNQALATDSVLVTGTYNIQ